MKRGRFLLLTCLVFAGSTVLFSSAGASDGVAGALAWLRSVQRPDGGFSSGFSEGSDVGATADAVIAIVSGGEDPADWRPAGASPIDFLRSQAADVTSPGLAAKVSLALIAAGEHPSDVNGVDLTAAIADGFESGRGLYGGGPYDSALAILALAQTSVEATAGAVDGLHQARLPDGSYSFDGTMLPGSGDSNTTALAVQALIVVGAAEETPPSFDYFRKTQNDDGGWTYQKPSAFGEATDANSTALVIQALLAGGQDLAAWGDPQAVLLGLQQPSGALAFNADTPGDNALATIQAIPAMAGVDLTDLRAMAAARQSPDGAATAVFLGAAILLVVVLALSAVVGRTERS